MKHNASPDFWTCYRSLPEDVRKLADQAFEHLKQDPQYPSLHFKKVGRFWSARVGGNYRAAPRASLSASSGGGLLTDPPRQAQFAKIWRLLSTFCSCSRA